MTLPRGSDSRFTDPATSRKQLAVGGTEFAKWRGVGNQPHPRAVQVRGPHRILPALTRKEHTRREAGPQSQGSPPDQPGETAQPPKVVQ